jgi:hypothetical protein
MPNFLRRDGSYEWRAVSTLSFAFKLVSGLVAGPACSAFWKDTAPRVRA